MLRVYRTNDGARFAAQSAEDLVHEMHQASRAPAASDADYMREVAGRIAALGGKPVRIDTATAFVADLLATGYLSKEGLK